MTIDQKDSATLSTDCSCVSEIPGEDFTDCLGCYDDDHALVTELFEAWIERNGDKATDTIRIDGKAMGWQRLDGYKIMEGYKVKDLPTSLGLNGSDYRLEYELDGAELTATRWSHDEPTGAGFVFSFVPDELDLTE